jgi:peptide/nickel transport system permease protein
MTTAPSPAARPADEAYFVAGQWQLFWLSFVKHKAAVVSLVVVVLLYLVALFAEFIAPLDPNAANARFTYAPPQRIALFSTDAAGTSRFGLNVPSLAMKIDPVAIRRVFTPDPSKPIPVGFFVKSEPYLLLGTFPMERKLIGPLDRSQPVFFLGADRLGRDIFSRVVHGARVSLSIGLIGVGISLVLGVVLGGISGYYGGWADMIIQRIIEFLRSIPTIPLWMGLAAAVPLGWPPLRTYFVITLIISLLGWTSLAREVRGRFLSLRNEDFVTAARLDGASEARVIFRHMLPSFISHVIAVLTLAVPAMILAETSLSFLGIGLQPPIVSWGVLLQEAQNIRAVSQAPWLLFVPGAAVVVSVLALNFLGDGLRDAADPYNK